MSASDLVATEERSRRLSPEGHEPAPANAPRRQWTINGDFLALQAMGVARYAREVTLALDALVAERHPLAEGLDICIVAPRAPPEALELQALSFQILPEFNAPRLPQAWVQFQLPRQVRGGLLSFCNLAPVAVKRQIVCIHDLQTRLTPQSYTPAFRLVHRIILPLLGRRVARITTVSALSREHLVRFGVASPGKITVTYNGADHALSWQPGKARLDFQQKRPFVLCLGRGQAHKNIELLFRLAAPLGTLGIDLFMAGDAEELAARWFGTVPTNVRLLGRIDDDDLAAALSHALCFLLPSRMEGFGLPAVEAMAWGCPVIASTAPSLPEVCGDAASYADPDDVEAWVAAIARLRSDPTHRQRRIAAGRDRARDFSWRGIAIIYLTLMAELDDQLAAPAGA